MAGTRFAVYAAVAVAASVALLAALLVLVPKLTTSATGQTEAKRVIAFELKYNYSLGRAVMETHPVRVADMQPNSAVTILDPFSKDMAQYYRDSLSSGSEEAKGAFIQKAEPYSVYTLVRLPEWLSGSKDDISSYRAYSAVALSSGCLIKYFAEDGRWTIDDPCHSDRYRPWDGLAIAGSAALGMTSSSVPSNTGPLALATLALSVDKDGYIAAKKPDLSASGSPGQGRRLSQDEIAQSNREMLDAADRNAGYALPFPDTGALGKHNLLATITPAQPEPNVRVTGDLRAFAALYVDYSSLSRDRIEIAAYPVESYPDLALKSSPSDPVKSMVDAAPSEGQHVKSGPGIAGRYAVLTTNYAQHPTYAGAKLWGKGTDGTDLFVTVTATDMTMDELLSLAKGLGLGPD